MECELGSKNITTLWLALDSLKRLKRPNQEALRHPALAISFLWICKTLVLGSALNANAALRKEVASQFLKQPVLWNVAILFFVSMARFKCTMATECTSPFIPALLENVYNCLCNSAWKITQRSRSIDDNKPLMGWILIKIKLLWTKNHNKLWFEKNILLLSNDSDNPYFGM